MSDKQHMTSRDINALMVLNGLEILLTANEADLKKLADRVDGWEKLQEARRLVISVGEDIIENAIPDDQYGQVYFQQRRTIAHVGLRKPTGNPEEFWVMAIPDIVTLVDGNIHYECLACDGHKNDCKLRKILKTLPIEGVDTGFVACWRDD